MMTKFVNLFGGPGVGKSTTAAALFVEMKKAGLSVELVTEVAKDFVWEDRSTTLSIQPYITIKQFRNLVRLVDKVDYVITDAPILMGCVYADIYAPDLPTSYKDFIVDLHRQKLNPSVNFVLNRVFEYDTTGRYQSEKTAIDIDSAIEDVLLTYDVKYFRWTPTSLDGIISHITKM
jgi:predicted ATPase